MADPIKGMADAVRAHADAAIGTHVRAVTGAAGLGGKVMDVIERTYRSLQGPKRRTTDIRLPSPPKRRAKAR